MGVAEFTSVGVTVSFLFDWTVGWHDGAGIRRVFHIFWERSFQVGTCLL